MINRFSLFASTLAVLAVAIATPAFASNSLIGSSVTGYMYINDDASINYFDPTNGYVPAGYENDSGTTVTISGAENEFGYQDGANTDTAGFSGSQLFLYDASNYNDSASITYEFTDPSFTGASLVSDDFPNGVTYSFSGDTVSITTADFSVNNYDSDVHALSIPLYGAVLNVTGAPTPEAGTTVSFAVLLALGLGAGLISIRKKKSVASV